MSLVPLFTAVLVAALAAVGSCWAWGLPASSIVRQSPLRRVLWWAAVSVLAGLLAALAAGYFTGLAAHFSRPWLGFMLMGVGGAGYFLGPRPRRFPRLLAGWSACALVSFLLLIWPGRGAWLVGGWDPGLYVNEGAAAARTGTFQLPPIPFYQQLGSEVMTTLTAPARGYRELFPGLPIDVDSGVVSLQFPRLTSVAFGVMGLLGGAEAGWRTPLLLAAAAWLLWVALWAARLRSRVALAAAALVLGAQPVFLYHAHTPSSELLELLLVGGLLLARASDASPRARAGWSALLLAAASANRTSFVLFGALWLVLVAWAEVARLDRRRAVGEHLLLAASLAAGALSHHLVTPVAVIKLAHILPRIEIVSAALIGLAALIDVGSAFAAMRIRCARWTAPGLRLLLGAGLLALLILTLRAGGEAAGHALALGPYLGWPLLVLAGLGVLVYAVRGREVEALVPLVWCLAITLVVLDHPHVAELQPWATKRYLAFTVPLLAWGVGLLLEAAATLPRGRWLAWSAAGLAFLLHLPLGRAAWRATSYDGLPTALKAVAERLYGANGVVADHFAWATPLALTWGVPVVNGEVLWRAPKAEATRLAWRTLADRAANGQRILILTSTRAGASLWGPGAPALDLVWTSGPITYRETRHHRETRGFSTREKEREFRIYQLLPGDPP